jgi:hypothetical protein
MNKLMAIGLIILASGYIASALGKFVGSHWSFSHPTTLGGPYAYSVGITGVVILML